MLVGTFALTLTTSKAFAKKGDNFNNQQYQSSNTHNGGNAGNGVNGGHDHGHERACQNDGAAEHNPHC
jgi:hypothetical protein